MKLSVRTTAENRPRIADEGCKAARRKFEESRAAIEKAMRVVEMDVEKHGGVYPYAGGRLTTAEILRRSGKSEAYLRRADQPSLTELKQRVQDFVDRANRLIPQGVRSIRRNVTDKVREVEAELKLVKQAYSETEQEFSDMLKKFEIAEKTIEELRVQNTALRKELSNKTVVELYPTHG